MSSLAEQTGEHPNALRLDVSASGASSPSSNATLNRCGEQRTPVTTVLIDDFTDLWGADASGLWALAPVAGYVCPGAMGVTASGGAPGDSPPFAAREFAPPLDLRGYDELRFWFRSTRPGDGTPARPFYLSLEADTVPASGAPWSRLIPVTKPDTWELHRLWLADMSEAMRAAVGVLRLRSLDPTVAFAAAIDSLIATAPEPVQDVEAALHARLHERFEVATADGPLWVPAVFDLPEGEPGHPLPYILITPWSLERLPAERGGGAIIDNHTEQGAYVRPPAERLRLRYSLDAFAAERAQKAALFEHILRDWLRAPHLIVANERLEIVPFTPAVERVAAVAAARRTPIFCEVTTTVDVFPRQFQPWAVPFVLAAPLDGRETAELTVP